MVVQYFNTPDCVYLHFVTISGDTVTSLYQCDLQICLTCLLMILYHVKHQKQHFRW